jgi:hypothetical protein
LSRRNLQAGTEERDKSVGTGSDGSVSLLPCAVQFAEAEGDAIARETASHRNTSVEIGIVPRVLTVVR